VQIPKKLLNKKEIKMKKIVFWMILFLVVSGMGFTAEMNADQLIAKYLEARGGLAKIQAIQTMHITGKVLAGPQEFSINMEYKRPNQVRMDITVQGQVIVQAYDGKQGWSINPFAGYQGGKKDVQPMGPDETKEFEVQADIDGPLVDYAKKGHTVEYIGQENVEGSPAYKLKVTLKSGTVTTMFLDADTFLNVKDSSKMKMRDTEIENEILYSDFKEVNGIMIAHAMETKAKDSPTGQKIIFEKVEINVPVDAARFVMPMPEKAPEAPKLPGASS
jgi:outer membrane lipoprotein-sorting protein